MFWHNDALQFLISGSGVIVFTGSPRTTPSA